MRTFGLLTLLALACIARAEDDPDPEPPGVSAKDLRALQGKWVVSHMTYKGQDRKPPREMSYTFKGNKLTIDSGGKGTTSTIKINTSKRPFTLEMVREGSKVATKQIYKIEKGQLFIGVTWIKIGKPPTDFSGTDAPVLVLTKKRSKVTFVSGLSGKGRAFTAKVA